MSKETAPEETAPKETVAPREHPKRLEPGDAAPKFALKDQDGRTVKLADYRGRRVIVYFYPAAMTPACAMQACDFRDSFQALAAAGFAVLGISPDEPERLARFAERDGLNFPLLSDPDHAVSKKYGVWGPKLLYGRWFEGLHRSTFVIDEAGRIELPLYAVKATGHVARLRTKLGI